MKISKETILILTHLNKLRHSINMLSVVQMSILGEVAKLTVADFDKILEKIESKYSEYTLGDMKYFESMMKKIDANGEPPMTFEDVWKMMNPDK